jgi:hypothetical protein
MPSAVYLLDMQQPGRKVAEVLELVRPVIASTQNTKVGLRQADSTVIAVSLCVQVVNCRLWLVLDVCRSAEVASDSKRTKHTKVCQ